MKKKILTIALSMVLCFGSSLTVMAADSPVASNGGATATVNGQEVTFVQDDWANAEVTAEQGAALSSYNQIVNSLVNEETMTEAEKKAAYEQGYISFVKQVTGIEAASMPVHYITEISKPAGITDADLAAGVAITFSAPQISAGDNIIVLHLKADGVWEVIPATAGNGQITGTFTSLSPVFYAVYTTSASEAVAGEAEPTHSHSYYDLVVAPTETTWGYTSHTCECGYVYYDNYVAPSSAATAAAVTSPKTGETEMPAVAVVLAAIATAGVLVCTRRKVNA